MKYRLKVWIASCFCVLTTVAQSGLIGFANYSDLGLQGTTGGMGGKIVHVTTREELTKYAGADEPYIIIIDADLKGHYDYDATPKRKHDVISVKSNKTIIGGGSGARLDSLGLDIRGQQNIIIRNLKITKADPDAISCRNTHHVWVDHCDLSSQPEDREENDGLLDFTYGSSYLTVSWCKFHDHNKTSICSSGTRNIADHGKQRVTYHHNAFINCTQRNPRIGYGLGHIFNDYNENNSVYAIGFFARAHINVENSLFRDVKEPFCQMYSADYGEQDAYWGFLKSTGNKFENTQGNTSGNSDGFDVSRYYLYDFALDDAANVASLVERMGCVSGLESDIIPFPGDGAIGVLHGTTLACGDIEGAKSYIYKIGTSPDKLQVYNPATFVLQPSTIYYWQVTVKGGKHNGKTSGIFRFSTADAKAHFPTPADGERHASLREIASTNSPCAPVSLRWREAFDAVGYTVYVGTDANLSGVDGMKVNGTSFQPSGLKHGITYYWRVDTNHADSTVTKGTVWSFCSDISHANIGRNEVEHGIRGGLCFPTKWALASNDSCNVGDQGPGYTSFVWAGEAGHYDISTAYLDEKSGQGWFGLYVNEERKDEWTATANNDSMAIRTTKSVYLKHGDEIRIEFVTDGRMRCRVDYVDINMVQPIMVGHLTAERMVTPMSIATPTPRLGWKIYSQKNDVLQTAYHVIVASTKELAEQCEGDLWDATVNSDQSQWITYEGKPLRSNTRCYWRVRVTTTQGESNWSDVAMWNVGLLNESDWQGQWIGLDKAMPWDVEEEHSRLSSRYLRHEFDVEKPVKSATLYISGLGMYEAFINGNKVGDKDLAQLPSDYRRTVYYDAYDVTDMLTQGRTAIGVVLGNGRYYTMQQNKKPYKITNFGYPKLRAYMIINYEDGKQQKVSTGTHWKLTADGPMRSNNEYDGELYDARKELGRWMEAGYDDTGWQSAERVAIPLGTLRGSMTRGMKVLKNVQPVRVTKHDGGVVVDMGQNMAGWLSVRMRDIHAGDTVYIRFAEKLNDDGSLYVANLRHAESTDRYVAHGKEQGEWWHSHFSYHGFRYAEIRGMGDALTVADFEGQVISDDMAQTGWFECADTILNKVYRNAVWGVLGNYKGMPVDCPQRDERQPWLGDRTRGCFGEAFLFDNNTLYAKWTRDICEAQREDGCIPDVAPAFWNYYSDDVTWPAALPFSMEMLHRQYGDDKPLRKWYGNVKLWLNHLKYQYGRDGLMPRDKYGDWCVPPEDLTLVHAKDPSRQTDGTLIATAYYYRLNLLMAKFARLQSLEDDVTHFEAEAERTKQAFNDKFLIINKGTSTVPGHLLYPDSTCYLGNTVTANLLPLVFGMIDDDYVKGEVEKNIIRNIIMKNGGHVSCGVIGISWLMNGLSDMGRGDIAWLLATNKSYPSWGYMAEHGATTIWELWNGDTANPSMNSCNHVMLLGDLLTWLYERVIGIAADEKRPGFKHIIMHPDFNVDEINFINGAYESIYGTIHSKWKKVNGKLHWDITIPANTTATITLPDGTSREIGSGNHQIVVDMPMRHPAIVKNEFLYTTAPFPECHSASIAENKDGDLVATYFGGTKERNPDVCIWVSRKLKGCDEWTAPQLVADGVFKTDSEEARLAGLSGLDSTTTAADKGPIVDATIRQHPEGYQRKACWNPVIHQQPDGRMELDFKIGSFVADWTGWRIYSSDGGKTWCKRENLSPQATSPDDQLLGPVKNKPIVNQGRIIAPTSIEKGGWRLFFEYSDDGGKTWQRTDYVESAKEELAIQPAILVHQDGRLQAVARTRNRHVATTFSNDNGKTWSKLQMLDVPNNNSGLDAVTLRDGTFVMVCNDWPIEPDKQKGVRTPLSLLRSTDGLHWTHWITLEDSPVSQYSYPSIIQTEDDHLHCVYTWRRQRIKHVEIAL